MTEELKPVSETERRAQINDFCVDDLVRELTAISPSLGKWARDYVEEHGNSFSDLLHTLEHANALGDLMDKQCQHMVKLKA